MKFRDKLVRFMQGRYGPDNLYNFLFIIYIILFIIDIFINTNIISVLEIVIVFIMIYRLFSKNIYARRKENQIYLKIKGVLVKPLVNLKRNIKDKEHVYKKCRRCKTTLKLPLPSKRGINHAKCPHCKNKVTLFTLKKEKIEIITNKK